jgi:hypothetical protein
MVVPSFTIHLLPQFRAGLGKRWVVKDTANVVSDTLNESAFPGVRQFRLDPAGTFLVVFRA